MVKTVLFPETTTRPTRQGCAGLPASSGDDVTHGQEHKYALRKDMNMHEAKHGWSMNIRFTFKLGYITARTALYNPLVGRC